MRFAVLLTLGLSASVACGPGNGLEGSLSQAYELEHTRTRARRYSTELAIEYVDRRGAVPVRISVYVPEGETLGKGTYDLVERGDLTGRTAEGQPIPRLRSGSVELEDYADRDGARVRARADAKFDVGDDTLTLHAEVDTELERVDWPLRPAVTEVSP